MRTSSAFRAAPAAGFTLIELMVVVVIATILLVIAIPSYTAQMRQSRRTEAKTALLDLAGREERYLATNGSYTNSGTTLGYPGEFPQNTSSNYYSLNITNVNAATPGTATTAAVPATFLITATAVAGSPQAADTLCQTFSVDQLGNQTSTSSGGAASTGCW